MRHLDLCSGIGGFALAARWMGWETVQFVEIDKFCQRVLRKHWPDVPIHNDLKTFTAGSFRGRIGVLTAGYPCQPFSSAGKRRGEEDDRHLWPEVFRIVKECRPRWVVCENVAGHITMGLDAVLSNLESESYACQAVVIPACATGAPHRRDRVWIIANSLREQDKRNDEGRLCDFGKRNRKVTTNTKRVRQLQQERCKPDEWRWSGDHRQIVAGTTSDRWFKGNGKSDICGRQSKPFTGCLSPSNTAGARLPDRIAPEMERSQQDAQLERPDGRETESRVRSLDDGVSSRLAGFVMPDWASGTFTHPPPLVHGKVKDRVPKLKALGNAIAVTVAYEIFRSINEVILLQQSAR